MRRLILPLCLALWACDDDGGGGGAVPPMPDLPGTPLDAAVAVEDATAPPPIIDAAPPIEADAGPAPLCREGDPIHLNAEGTAEGDGWRIVGQTHSANNHDGSCAGDEVGADVVIRFTAPQAGYWRFSTQGSEFDTLLYAQLDCDAGFSELACNDNAEAGANHSEIAFRLDAGQDAFIIVDTAAGMSTRSFTLTAQPVPATAPDLQEVFAHFNEETGALGIRGVGLDPEEDVVIFKLALLKADGSPFTVQGQEIAFEQELSEVESVEGHFDAMIRGSLPPELAGFKKVTFSVRDALELWSQEHTVEVHGPAEVGVDAPCDFVGAFNLCAEGHACLDRDEDEAFTCAVITAPSLSKGDAYYNEATGALGVRVFGQDNEADARFAMIEPLDADGQAIGLGQAIGFAFTHVTEGASFEAYGGAVYPDLCASFTFDDCMQRTGGEDADRCQTNARRAMDDCAEALGLMTALRVQARDISRLDSEPLIIDIEPTPSVEDGDVCDLYAGVAICPEQRVCVNFATSDVAPICQGLQDHCPEDWSTVDLNAHRRGRWWSYRGDNSEALNHGGRGSCGGGGPNIVHTFTAPEEGRYEFVIEDTDGDTLMFARSHCALAQAEYELACNDDSAGYLSAFRLRLEADVPVYVFVDGYNGGFAGPYTLTVRPL